MWTDLDLDVAALEQSNGQLHRLQDHIVVGTICHQLDDQLGQPVTARK